MLTKNFLLDLFEYDRERGVLIWKNHWYPPTLSMVKGKSAGSISKKNHTNYLLVGIKNKHYGIHQLIWFIEKGKWPTEIDHIDGNGLNNYIGNLREVTHRENHHNRKRHRSGKLVGASFHAFAGRWRAHIQIKGKNKYLGHFDTEREAHKAYLNELQHV